MGLSSYGLPRPSFPLASSQLPLRSPARNGAGPTFGGGLPVTLGAHSRSNTAGMMLLQTAGSMLASGGSAGPHWRSLMSAAAAGAMLVARHASSKAGGSAESPATPSAAAAAEAVAAMERRSATRFQAPRGGAAAAADAAALDPATADAAVSAARGALSRGYKSKTGCDLPTVYSDRPLISSNPDMFKEMSLDSEEIRRSEFREGSRGWRRQSGGGSGGGWGGTGLLLQESSLSTAESRASVSARAHARRYRQTQHLLLCERNRGARGLRSVSAIPRLKRA
eukprot:359736-Chlamydomonas_euryale.AAC.6